MEATKLNEIATSWLKAFNNQNIEALLALYDNNASHFSPKIKLRKPETHGFITGKNALGAWWKDAFERLPSLHYEVVRLTPYENRVFMEYIRHVSNEEDLMVGEMLEIENGLIVKSSVFHQ